MEVRRAGMVEDGEAEALRTESCRKMTKECRKHKVLRPMMERADSEGQANVRGVGKQGPS